MGNPRLAGSIKNTLTWLHNYMINWGLTINLSFLIGIQFWGYHIAWGRKRESLLWFSWTYSFSIGRGTWRPSSLTFYQNVRIACTWFMIFILWIHRVRGTYYLIFEEFCYPFLHWRKSTTIGLVLDVSIRAPQTKSEERISLLLNGFPPSYYWLFCRLNMPVFSSILYTTWSSELLPFWIVEIERMGEKENVCVSYLTYLLFFSVL